MDSRLTAARIVKGADDGMTYWSHLAEDTTAFPWNKRTPWSGLEATAAIGIALLVGQLTGHESAGAIAAGAAFTIGFAVYHEAAASTLLSMALITAGIASATLLGSLGAAWTPLVLLLVLVASVNYGLLAGLGPTPGWIGQQCGVFVIISSYFTHGVHYAVGRASMVVVGGLLQMTVFASSRFWHPREPHTAPLHERLRLRTRQLWANLRTEASLSTRNETLLYTSKLAITLLLATALYRREHLGNGYWAPMTAILVLKPQWAHTWSRGIARLTGTLVGAGFAVFLATLHPLSQTYVLLLVMTTAWACYALQAVNYALFSMVLTLYVVYSFRFGGFSQPTAAHLRLLNTAIGGGLALVVDGVWMLLGLGFTSAAPALESRAQSVQ